MDVRKPALIDALQLAWLMVLIAAPVLASRVLYTVLD